MIPYTKGFQAPQETFLKFKLAHGNSTYTKWDTFDWIEWFWNYQNYIQGCAIADFNVKLIGKWEAKSGEYTVVNALTAWDKRTYNAITVEGDDQKWVKIII